MVVLLLLLHCFLVSSFSHSIIPFSLVAFYSLRFVERNVDVLPRRWLREYECAYTDFRINRFLLYFLGGEHYISSAGFACWRSFKACLPTSQHNIFTLNRIRVVSSTTYSVRVHQLTQMKQWNATRKRSNFLFHFYFFGSSINFSVLCNVHLRYFHRVNKRRKKRIFPGEIKKIKIIAELKI